MRYLDLEQRALDELKQAALDEARNPSGPNDMGPTIRTQNARDKLMHVHALARELNLSLRWHGYGYPETDKQRKAMDALRDRPESPDAAMHWDDVAQVAAGRIVRQHLLEAMAEIKDAMTFRIAGRPWAPVHEPLPHGVQARKIVAAALAGGEVEINIGELAAIASQTLANLSWGMIVKVGDAVGLAHAPKDEGEEG